MNGEPRHFFEFDAFRVEVEDRRLLRHGKPVMLTPKAFDILLALVGHSGRTVEKNDLMDEVWSDTFVEEGNLNRHVSTLRKILGDDPHEQRFIKTIPKHGYRFTADVREVVESNGTLAAKNIYQLTPALSQAAHENFWSMTRIVIAALAVISCFLLAALAISSRGQAIKQSGSARPVNTQASEDYAKGRGLWQTRSAQDLHAATLLLEQAVEIEPDFALAHAALADAYVFDFTNWKKAEQQANEAIRLDPNLGEPHATLGFVRMFWEWKLADAEREFKQAVTLSPDYSTAHQWFAVNLAATGHKDAALSEMKKALELDPDSPSINADMCQTFYFAHRYDEAIGQCGKTLDMNAKFLNAYLYLYEIYNAGGLSDEAVNTFYKIEGMTNDSLPSDAQDKLGTAYKTGGIREFWRMQIEILMHPTPQYYKLAQYYARLGDRDEAQNWLEKGYENRDFDIPLVLADPVFENFHKDVRFITLRERLLQLHD